MSFVSSIFHNKFEVDDRKPLWFFTLPSIPYMTKDATTFGFVFMEPMLWITAFALLMVQSVINIIAAVVIYEFILRRRGCWQSYIIGYGVVCPALLYLPVVLIQILDLRNMSLICCMALTSPALLVFRCMEAMHGELPNFAYNLEKPHEKNRLAQFIMYYAASIQFNFDPKTQMAIPLTKLEISQRTIHFARVFVEVAVLYSLMAPCDFILLPRREIYNVLDLFYWGNLLNNFLMAYLTGIALDSGATGLGLMTSLVCGISTTKFNDHPLLSSSSPSDFWGRRWNKIVGGGLRRGVFQPMRKAGYHRSIAALATFVASGCLHEYVLAVMTLRNGIPNNPQKRAYTPSYGNQWIFFA